MTKIWLKAAAIRAVRSFAQGALASIGTGAVLTEINWLAALCTGALAAVVSVLMSLAGLPEAKPDVMSGAGENFDLNGADRPRKCVESIMEIMELMGAATSEAPDTPHGWEGNSESETNEGEESEPHPDAPAPDRTDVPGHTAGGGAQDAEAPPDEEAPDDVENL